jgi:hypothetical protein
MFIAIPPHDHCVYQLISRDGQVIYVGSTSTIFGRMHQHAKDKDWWPQVRAIEVESFSTKDEMLDREQELIKIINPIYNDTYGLAFALTVASDFLDRPVTRQDIRNYIRREMTQPEPEVSEPVTPDGISLRQYADEAGLELATLTRWRERRSDFPVEVSLGANRTKLYDRDHLRDYVRSRLREPVSLEE